ncbi:hypothetical protein [Cellulomonas sp. HZM]|uniref:hypothetical protein n=1 Tax=Cellulomonas sp. HZM TaxID=1454010 RepID=UPI000493113A|nr:hypothetical protein [Cellulomonas sp. HZM]
MYSTTFTFEGRVLRLELGDATLEPGRGAHRLRIPFTYRCGAQSDHLSGRLIQVLGTVRDADGWHWLGDVPPVTLFVYPGDGATNNLALTLSDHQVLSLAQTERLDLDLQLELIATLLGEAVPPAVQSVQYRIPGRHWAELTERLGTHVGMYVRVPVPGFGEDDAHGDAAPLLRRAVDRLQQAKTLRANRDWERCVGACRNVLELLRSTAGIPRASGLPARQERSKDERWAALFDDAWSLTSAANHDDAVTSQFRWSRADADAVLAVTAALLVRYSELDS